MNDALKKALEQALQKRQRGEVEQSTRMLEALAGSHPEDPAVLDALGVQRRRDERYEEALDLAKQAAALAPEHANIRFNLGLSAQRCGDLALAVEAYRACLAMDPRMVPARINLAQALRETGELEEAERVLRRALEDRPDGPGILNNLGLVLVDLGDTEAAERSFRRAIEVRSDLADAWSNLGNLLTVAGRAEEALAVFREGIAAMPRSRDLHLNLGVYLRSVGRLADARDTLERARQLAPDDAEVLAELAAVYSRTYRYDRARETLDRALALRPDDTRVNRRYAEVLLAQGDAIGALARIDACTGETGDALELAITRAEILEQTNRLQEAQAVLDGMNDCGVFAHRIEVLRARLARRAGRPEEAVGVLQGLLEQELGAEDRRRCHFELVSAYDRLDQTDAAMQHMHEGNRIARGFWDAVNPSDDNPFLDQLRHEREMLDRPGWADEWTHLAPRCADGLRDPVWVVGFPRSGTTLLDQVLDAHPAVQVIEERPMLSRVFKRLQRMADGDLMRGISELSEDGRAELRALYWEWAAREVDLAADTVVVDKQPLRACRAHLAQRLFPESRFVFAVRHPCDAVLSCCMQNFAFNIAMTNFHSLEEGTTLYAEVLDMWDRIVEVMGLRPHYVSYEGMVEDIEREARALFEALSLPWDPQVLQFHRRAAAGKRINNPSYAQVSQPIYSHARFRWERYRAHLEAVLPRLAPYALRFGYPNPTAPPRVAGGAE